MSRNDYIKSISNHSKKEYHVTLLKNTMSYIDKYNVTSYNENIINNFIKLYEACDRYNVNKEYMCYIFNNYSLVNIDNICELIKTLKNTTAEKFDIKKLKMHEVMNNCSDMTFIDKKNDHNIYIISNSTHVTRELIQSLNIKKDDYVVVMNNFNVELVDLYKTENIFYCALKTNLIYRNALSVIEKHMKLFKKIFIVHDCAGTVNISCDIDIVNVHEDDDYRNKYYTSELFKHSKYGYIKKVSTCGYRILNHLLSNYCKDNVILVGFYGVVDKKYYAWIGHDYTYEQSYYKYINIGSI